MWLGNTSRDSFAGGNTKKAGLNETVYDFSSDYNTIDVIGIVDIRKYLIKNNNIK